MHKRNRIEETPAGAHLPPLLLDVPAVARLLSVGQTTVYALVKGGQLPTVKIGKSRRIRMTSVLAFIEQCQRTS